MSFHPVQNGSLQENRHQQTRLRTYSPVTPVLVTDLWYLATQGEIPRHLSSLPLHSQQQGSTPAGHQCEWDMNLGAGCVLYLAMKKHRIVGMWTGRKHSVECRARALKTNIPHSLVRVWSLPFSFYACVFVCVWGGGSAPRKAGKGGFKEERQDR